MLTPSPLQKRSLDDFIEQAKHFSAIKTAVVHPVDKNSLQGAVEAAEQGLIEPVLIGPSHKIFAAADELNIDIRPFQIMDAPHSHAAAEFACQLVREAEVELLMKGSLGTSELLEAVVDKDKGIRTDRRLSHVWMFDIPHYHKPLIITDAAINVTPDLIVKRHIVQNAIDFCHAIGIENPKIALLAAVEKVKPSMPSTLDAAALCKMADRQQITGAILDGPLAFDNAISLQAAQDKKIQSPVSGDADVLLAPDLESANMLAKQLIYLAHAQSAGLAVGAKVPIILTSRAEGAQGRLASCALACHRARQIKSALTV